MEPVICENEFRELGEDVVERNTFMLWIIILNTLNNI